MDRLRPRTKYEKNLDLRNIVIDKLLLGIAIIGFGVFLNYRLEGYRSELQVNQMREEYFLKERYQVVSEVQSLTFEMSAEIVSMVYDERYLAADSIAVHDSRYYDSLSKFSSRLSRSSHVLSPHYRNQFECIKLCYLDLVDLKASEWHKYESYMKFVRRVAQEVNRVELGISPSNPHLSSYEFVPKNQFDSDQPGKYLSLGIAGWDSLSTDYGE